MRDVTRLSISLDEFSSPRLDEGGNGVITENVLAARKNIYCLSISTINPRVVTERGKKGGGEHSKLINLGRMFMHGRGANLFGYVVLQLLHMGFHEKHTNFKVETFGSIQMAKLIAERL